jgi:hypothetical protein
LYCCSRVGEWEEEEEEEEGLVGRNEQELGQTRPSTSMTYRHTEKKKKKEGERKPRVGWALVEQGLVVRPYSLQETRVYYTWREARGVAMGREGGGGKR